MFETQKNHKNAEFSEKILSANSKIQWRKPSKFPGALASALIQKFSAHSEIEAVYICELSCENDQNKFSPLVALECTGGLSEAVAEALIAEVCQTIALGENLDQAINVCITSQVPEITQALKAGLSRVLYQRKR